MSLTINLKSPPKSDNGSNNDSDNESNANESQNQNFILIKNLIVYVNHALLGFYLCEFV